MELDEHLEGPRPCDTKRGFRQAFQEGAKKMQWLMRARRQTGEDDGQVRMRRGHLSNLY